ncbi:MAG: type II toxin-antitoxin system RelE/ParE family toxin [Myxococcus sp.]|nr:type II toxin-antitoxin system RelE/ParE family toxin [Myxococcus sp.]
MRRLRLSRAAKNDLVEIGVYTAGRWGEAQCERYLTQLDERIRLLQRRPESGRSCDDLKPGAWRITEGRHVIFYRFSEQRVDVLRVLHVQMLPERYL